MANNKDYRRVYDILMEAEAENETILKRSGCNSSTSSSSASVCSSTQASTPSI